MHKFNLLQLWPRLHVRIVLLPLRQFAKEGMVDAFAEGHSPNIRLQGPVQGQVEVGRHACEN
jgi:hypothetical protein